MLLKVKLDKKEFEVRADIEALLEKVNEFPKFEEDEFRTFEGGEDDIVTEDEFNDNLEYFKNKIKAICDDETYLEKIVNEMPKKKNGTFYKGRKKVVEYYNNTEFFTEWHNTWGTYELRFSSVSDLVVELQIVKYNHTPA